MTSRGRIEHGVVVLDPAHALPEDTQVEVHPLSPPTKPVGQPLEKLAGNPSATPAPQTQPTTITAPTQFAESFVLLPSAYYPPATFALSQETPARFIS